MHQKNLVFSILLELHAGLLPPWTVDDILSTHVSPILFTLGGTIVLKFFKFVIDMSVKYTKNLKVFSSLWIMHFESL